MPTAARRRHEAAHPGLDLRRREATQRALDLLRELRPPAWLSRTACRLEDSARLDAVVNGRPSLAEMRVRTEAAQELCARCPVKQACADDADARFTPGVCGGSLRFEATELGRAYVALPLIPGAATSRYDWPIVAVRFDAARDARSAPDLQERRDAAQRAPLLLTNAG